MKAFISHSLILALSLLFLNVNAQKETQVSGDKNNVIKLNLSALAFKNISLQYERKVSKRTSVALNVHTIPYGTLAFHSVFDNIVDQTFVEYDNAKFGSFGIVPEFRYYVGKKGALRGFYIAPFISYNNYKTNLPIRFSNNTRTGIFDGNLTAITGGLQFGSQFRLSNTVTLDWWIFGPNYGSANGTLNFASTLTTSEQSDIRNQLENLRNDLPFDIIKSYSVSGSGATINAKGPWAGLRGLGFNFGIRF